jgi:hypothetical protein
MNTIGKVLDVPKAKGYMDAYFKRMKTLTQNPSIPSRIRFLLLVCSHASVELHFPREVLSTVVSHRSPLPPRPTHIAGRAGPESQQMDFFGDSEAR